MIEQNTNGSFISIDKEIEEFSTYLESMNRAILSARYGDGKSTFLSEFSKAAEGKYIFFTIYPLNYQVAENKDIFEYIKRDLLLQMLSFYEFTSDEYEETLMLWGYYQENKFAILDDILNSMPNINVCGAGIETVAKPIKCLLKNIEKFRNYKEKINSLSKTTQIECVIESFENSKGSIYEFDIISQTITKIIQQIKSKEEDKKVVLVVEDLDRIDPAHIFRILNILSAHIERQKPGLIEMEIVNGSNKFDFDKILLVCDYNNIESIFHHLYGETADFKGYISKFSSHQHFVYSLKDKYRELILSKLDSEIMIHSQMMSILADLIIDCLKKPNNKARKKPNSLRHIINTLDTYNSFIKNDSVFISNMLHNIKDNNLIKLLVILKELEIDFDDFKIRAEEHMQEFVNFIAVSLLLYGESSAGKILLVGDILHLRKINSSNYDTYRCNISAREGVLKQIDILPSYGRISPCFLDYLQDVVTEIKKYIINNQQENTAEN